MAEEIVIIRPRAKHGAQLLNNDTLDPVFTFHLTQKESFVSSSNIAQHPVEEGSPIGDNIQQKSDLFEMSCLLTDTPLSGDLEENISFGLVGSLLGIKDRRELVTVGTRFRNFTNMAISSINISRDVSLGQSVLVKMKFQAVRIALIEFSYIPPELLATPETDAGRQDADDDDDDDDSDSEDAYESWIISTGRAMGIGS